jgi:hypothetical protein
MKLSLFLIATGLALFTHPAAAYIGPGAGIGALGTAAALIGAFLLLIVGFVWYPVKRLLNRRKGGQPQRAVADPEKVSGKDA